jgi:hypothetical protein
MWSGMMVVMVNSKALGLGIFYPDTITIYKKLSLGCQMIWNYFAISHGKEEVEVLEPC